MHNLVIYVSYQDYAPGWNGREKGNRKWLQVFGRKYRSSSVKLGDVMTSIKTWRKYTFPRTMSSVQRYFRDFFYHPDRLVDCTYRWSYPINQSCATSLRWIINLSNWPNYVGLLIGFITFEYIYNQLCTTANYTPCSYLTRCIFAYVTMH